MKRRIDRVAEGHNRQVAVCDELSCPNVGIDLKELGGSAAVIFEFLPMD